MDLRTNGSRMSKISRKKDEPVVEWVTSAPGLIETYPIIPARKALPEWFKNSDTKIPMAHAHSHGMQMPAGAQAVQPPALPGARTETPTIRACPGVIDVMRSGYLLRAWTDIEITTPEPARGDGTDKHTSRTAMSPGEIGGKMGAFGPGLNQMLPLWPGEYDFALKLDSPWVCKTPPGWSLLYLPVPYADKTPFRILPGITDNDNFHVVNVLAMWDHYGHYIIEAGTPICWLLPVRRDGFQLKTEVTYNPERSRVMRAYGKGGAGENGGRLIHGSYLKERMRRREKVK